MSCYRCDPEPRGCTLKLDGCPQTPFMRPSGVTLHTAVPGCLPTIPDSASEFLIYDNLPRAQCDPSTLVCASLTPFFLCCQSHCVTFLQNACDSPVPISLSSYVIQERGSLHCRLPVCPGPAATLTPPSEPGGTPPPPAPARPEGPHWDQSTLASHSLPVPSECPV